MLPKNSYKEGDKVWVKLADRLKEESRLVTISLVTSFRDKPAYLLSGVSGLYYEDELIPTKRTLARLWLSTPEIK